MNMQTPTATHTMKIMVIIMTFTNTHVLYKIRVVSQVWEMLQLRQTLDMQACTSWLISTAQLCRAIAAWLPWKKAFSFLFALLLFPDVCLLSQHGFLKLLVALLLLIISSFVTCNQIDDATLM